MLPGPGPGGPPGGNGPGGPPGGNGPGRPLAGPDIPPGPGTLATALGGALPGGGLTGTPLAGTPLPGTPLAGTPLTGAPLSGAPLVGGFTALAPVLPGLAHSGLSPGPATPLHTSGTPFGSHCFGLSRQ